MVDEKKPTPTPAGPTAGVTAGTLGRASESGDPAVQHALAELQTAQLNRAALDVEEADVKAADEAVAAARKKLNELGYE